MRQVSRSDASLLEAFFPKSGSNEYMAQSPQRASNRQWRFGPSMSPDRNSTLISSSPMTLSDDGTVSDNISDNSPQASDFQFSADELSSGLWSLDPAVVLELRQLHQLGRSRCLSTGWFVLWRLAAFGGVLWQFIWLMFGGEVATHWADWSDNALLFVCWNDWACLAALFFFANGVLASWRAYDAERGSVPGATAFSSAAVSTSQEVKLDIGSGSASSRLHSKAQAGQGASRSCPSLLSCSLVAAGPVIFAVALTATALAGVGFWVLTWPNSNSPQDCTLYSGCIVLSGGGTFLLLLIDGALNQLQFDTAYYLKWCLVWPLAWALVQIAWVRGLGYTSCYGDALSFQDWHSLPAVGGGFAVLLTTFFGCQVLLRCKEPKDASSSRVWSQP